MSDGPIALIETQLALARPILELLDLFVNQVKVLVTERQKTVESLIEFHVFRRATNQVRTYIMIVEPHQNGSPEPEDNCADDNEEKRQSNYQISYS